MQENEDGGDSLALARFLFDEWNPPGRVVLDMDTQFNGVVGQFRFLCDLYITGVKLYNDIDPAGEINDLMSLRTTTIDFVADRMSSALSVRPTLEILEGREQPPDNLLRYRFTSDTQDIARNALEDLKLNTRLTMQFVYS